MEVGSSKHLKYAFNPLLIMDHDSGYVEGVESFTSSSNEAEGTQKIVAMRSVSSNFLLSEDALLEKPEVSFSPGANLPFEIIPDDYEESRKVFFSSPDRISDSAPSQASTVNYSGLESDPSSSGSAEIPLQKKIIANSNDFQSEEDVLILSASEKDMSLELSLDSGVTENVSKCCSLSQVKEKKRLTLVFSKSANDDEYSVKRKYPSMTPEKKSTPPADPNISPDIFEDVVIEHKPTYFEVPTLDSLTIQAKSEQKNADKLDEKLLKRTMIGLSGVLPPPSVTVIHMSADDILKKFEENKEYHFCSVDKASNISNESKSLLLSVSLEEAKKSTWPDVLDVRSHGLHYNCGKISEEIVELCDKYQKRFVGAETQSTCTIFETQVLGSPSKRKMGRPRWGTKSPGRRLSHLARRRITFSSANLQAGGSSLVGSRARQILVDAKKIDLLNRRKSPRKSPRKTPRKSPMLKTRTPSSSAKKKLALRFRKLTGEIEKSVPGSCEAFSVSRALFKSPNKATKSENSKGNTKRALFQSPNRDSSSSLFASVRSQASAEKSQLRRALFTSPLKNSPAKHSLRYGFEKKRKRSESEDLPPGKFPRSMSMDVKPVTSNGSKPVSRAQSEMNLSLNRSQSQNDLTEQHKKKLLWAVSGALQSQNITNTHPQWKIFASVLARVTKRCFASQIASGIKAEGGTTERMHRIARYHVISVIKGKSADEIVKEYEKSRTRVLKPQGYVPPEDFNSSKIRAPSGGKENIFQDRANTMESWEKRRLEEFSKPLVSGNKIDRIRKVINFGDDR